MSRGTIDDFCTQVCRCVRFWPDHKAITAELTAHLEPSRYIGRCPQQVEEFIAHILKPIFDANPDAVEQHANLSV